MEELVVVREYGDCRSVQQQLLYRKDAKDAMGRQGTESALGVFESS
jgi:hypothetical protein